MTTELLGAVRKQSARPAAFTVRWDKMAVDAMAGDKAAYRQLLIETSKWLRGFFARRLDANLVDDAIQDSLIALHLKLNTFEPGRSFVAWLTGIARHKWLDKLRQARAEPLVELEDRHWVDSKESATIASVALDKLLATLRPNQADAIRVHKLDGHSAEDASRLTGQSPSLVKVNAHRGIARLQLLVAQDAAQVGTVPA